MINNIIEFENFLKNPKIYDSNVIFWKKIIHSYNSDFTDWMNNSYANGEIIRDGNPLVAMKFRKIAIRIIQLERNSLKPKFASWIKKYEDFQINELVICIQPYITIYNETKKLIDLFFKNKHQRFQKATNSKYNTLLNRNRTSFLVKKYDAISDKDFIVRTNLSIDKEAAKVVLIMAKSLEPNDSIFKANRISRPYNLSLRKAQEIDFELGQKVNKTIAKRINKDFEDLKNQLEKLKSEIETD